MHNPTKEMDPDELRQFLEALQNVLYLEEGNWNPDKPCGADEIGEICNLMEKYGLVPDPGRSEKLVCPHCGYDGKGEAEHGSGPFRFLRDVTVYHQVRTLESNHIDINGYYEVYDTDADNPRLECRNCLNEFAIPAGIEIDFV